MIPLQIHILGFVTEFIITAQIVFNIGGKCEYENCCIGWIYVESWRH